MLQLVCTDIFLYWPKKIADPSQIAAVEYTLYFTGSNQVFDPIRFDL